MGAYDYDYIENILSDRKRRMETRNNNPEKPNKSEVKFSHGALVFRDTYEEQARKQGYTLGDKAGLMEKLSFGLTLCHVHEVLTQAEYKQALQRLDKKLLESLEDICE